MKINVLANWWTGGRGCKDNLCQQEVFVFFGIDGSSVLDFWKRAEVVTSHHRGREGDDGDQGEGDEVRGHAGEEKCHKNIFHS